ncbi:MAG: hypothetical protein ACOC0U_01100 [Desulfovibrionales bacterium]
MPDSDSAFFEKRTLLVLFCYTNEKEWERVLPVYAAFRPLFRASGKERAVNV